MIKLYLEISKQPMYLTDLGNTLLRNSVPEIHLIKNKYYFYENGQVQIEKLELARAMESGVEATII